MVKLKAIFFGTALTITMSACEEIYNNEPKDANKQNLSQIKTEDEAAKRKKQQNIYYFRQRISDSVLTANGGLEYRTQLKANRSKFDDEHEIEDLTREYSLGYVMTDQVLKSGIPIIDRGYMEIVAELSKYKINLDDYIEQSDNNGSFRAKPDVVKYPEDFLKSDMCFTGVGEKDPEFDGRGDYFWDGLQTLICYDIIEKTECTANQKNSMRAKVEQIISKTKRKLVTNRKNIERQYAAYYLLDDYSNKYLGLSWGGEGSYVYGYEDLNNDGINGKYLVSMRSVHVYDSKLNIDFFGEPDCEYKLISLGNYKWQVIRKDKSGKIDKTPVFSDKRKYNEYNKSETERPETLSYFDFYPGEKMGVHIEYDEVVKIKQRKKDWKPKMPKDIAQTVDSLNQEVSRKDELQTLYWAAVSKADSIANKLTKDKYGVVIR